MWACEAIVVLAAAWLPAQLQALPCSSRTGHDAECSPDEEASDASLLQKRMIHHRGAVDEWSTSVDSIGQRSDDYPTTEALLPSALPKEYITRTGVQQSTVSGCICKNSCDVSFYTDASAQPLCKVTGPDECSRGKPYWDLLLGHYDYCTYASTSAQDSAKAKAYALWSKITADPTSGPFFDRFEIAAGVFSESVIVSVDTKSDVFPYIERKKYIRPVGVVAAAKFVARESSPYTGVFQGSDHVLVRLSLTEDPQGPLSWLGLGNYAPGASLKFLRDGEPSANILGFTSFKGQKCYERNFFAHPISNHVAAAEGLSAVVPWKYQQASFCTQMLGLSDAAKESGKDPQFPFEVQFHGVPNVRFSCSSLSRSWRQFKALRPGQTLFKVWARSGPNEALEDIGDVILTARFTTSGFGDKELFFQHQRMEDDFAIHPEWLGQIDKERDCGQKSVGLVAPQAASGFSSIMGVRDADPSMVCPKESPNSSSFVGDPFNGPTCETLSPQVQYATGDVVKGIQALLAKQAQLKHFNRARVTKWNRTALPNGNSRFDEQAVKSGYRPYSGQYMRPEQRLMGAAYQEFTNMTPGGHTTDRAPSPLKVAHSMLFPAGERKCDTGVNQWFSVWIQLQTEDWVEGENDGAGGRHGPNLVTHWWDQSSTYGTGYPAVMSHRTFSNGMVDPDKVATQGGRGQWVGLSTIRYAVASEHNLIAKELATLYPEMEGDDERLFGTARLIVTAEMARIHTLEWTTILLPGKATVMAQKTLWDGILSTLVPLPSSLLKAFKAVAKRFFDGSTLNTLFGIVGGTMQHEYDFAWPEAFSLVYRMHTLLPDGLDIAGKYWTLEELLNATHGVFSESPKSMPTFDYSEAAKGLSEAPTCALAGQNYPKALEPLAEIDIAASRKRGATSYNNFRRALHLNAAKSFEDLVTNGATPTARDTELIGNLSQVYRSVEDVDALVGLLVEPRLPGAVLGITSYLVFVLMTPTRLESDPFFTENYNRDFYTDFGLEWVKKREFADLLQDHLGIAKRPGKSGFLA